MRDYSRDKKIRKYVASGKTIACNFTGAFTKVDGIKIVTSDDFLCSQTRVSINGIPIISLGSWHPFVGRRINVQGQKVTITDLKLISEELETYEFMYSGLSYLP